MATDAEGYELETYRRVWYIETGYCDGGGMGYWEVTKESHKLTSHAACESMRDEWIAAGKLEHMPWGEPRPTFGYGLFRIRSELERIE